MLDEYRYYDEALGINGTADELFIQARNGYIEEPAALAKIQEILSNPVEQKTEKAFYVGVLKEIAEDAGDKPYVFAQMKKDILDGVNPDEVELRDGLTLSVLLDRESVVLALVDMNEYRQGGHALPVGAFLGLDVDGFAQLLGAVYYYSMVPIGDFEEAVEEDGGGEVEWVELASKSVPDGDGFMTDYTLFYNAGTGVYICMFGDKELYESCESRADAEFSTREEAFEWFEAYKGFTVDEIALDPEAKERVVRAMEVAGYYYNEMESHDGYRNFNGDGGVSLTFDNFSEVAEWLEEVCFDDAEIEGEVERILHPEWHKEMLDKTLEDAEGRVVDKPSHGGEFEQEHFNY